MKPELLSPVGDWPMLRAALQAGADAVYFGVKELNMRITARNFELSELQKVVNECYKHKVKAYLTLNTIVYENELGRVKRILHEAKKAKVDAVIAWDMAVIGEARRLKIPVHLSTQAAVSNFEAVRYYNSLGIRRINMARECSLEQIREIAEKIKKNRLKIQIETFVHGAMCVSISGRCFTSQFLFNRSANRGDCLQPCRREYLVEGVEEGRKLLVGNNYILSPKDLCCLGFIEKLIEAGINAFKIEGRNRSPEYVKTVTECYREAIDSYFENKKINKSGLLAKLKTVYNRGFSTGFYLGIPTEKEFTDAYGSKATTKKEYVGYVKNFYKKINVAEVKIESSGLKIGDDIMFVGNKTGVRQQKIRSMQIEHKDITKAGKGKVVGIKTKGLVRPNDKVFLIKRKNNLLNSFI
jgi:putative protease